MIKDQNRARLEIEAHRLRQETSRIANVTLRGNFSREEDRQYWVERLRKLTSQLSSIERDLTPSRPKTIKRK